MAKRVKSIPTPTQDGYLTKELLGEFIRARRTQEGLKMHDVAMLCGISIATLTNIEKAEANVRIDSALNVAKMLGIKIKVEPWDSETDVK
jgi:transcriptional regulator with XRE-family HTH domain